MLGHQCTLMPFQVLHKIFIPPSGNLVFHGPREEVVPHFQSLGFHVPERKAVSDFLQEVTSQKDQKVGPFHLPLLIDHFSCMALM